MIGLLEEAAHLQRLLDDGGFRFCFIGGLAVQCWGEPRYTQDLDLQLAVAFGAEAEASNRLAKIVPPRVTDAVQFAARSRVYLGQMPSGTPVDVAFGGTKYEARILDRSSMPPSYGFRVCSAEDLIVMKTFAARDRDWVDVAGIVTRQGVDLDWSVVEEELTALVALRGESSLPKRLLEMRDT